MSLDKVKNIVLVRLTITNNDVACSCDTGVVW